MFLNWCSSFRITLACAKLTNNNKKNNLNNHKKLKTGHYYFTGYFLKKFQENFTSKPKQICSFSSVFFHLNPFIQLTDLIPTMWHPTTYIYLSLKSLKFCRRNTKRNIFSPIFSTKYREQRCCIVRLCIWSLEDASANKVFATHTCNLNSRVWVKFWKSFGKLTWVEWMTFMFTERSCLIKWNVGCNQSKTLRVYLWPIHTLTNRDMHVHLQKNVCPLPLTSVYTTKHHSTLFGNKGR